MKRMRLSLRPAEFQRLYAEGKIVRNRLLVLHYLENGLEVCRIGYSVSKKLGNAVMRNRIKRRLREVVRSIAQEIEPGYDLVLSARVRCRTADYRETVAAVVDVVTRAGLNGRGTIPEGAGDRS